MDLTQKTYFPRVLVLSAMSLLFSACGGGGGDADGSNSVPTDSNIAITGSAVKGPLANAFVEAYALDVSSSNLQGPLLDTGSTDSNAQFTDISLDPNGGPYLLVVSSDADTVDITTGTAPTISRLQTVVSTEALLSSNPVYATPLTSMAVEILSTRDDVSVENFDIQLVSAQNQVKTALGFGLDLDIDLFTTPPILTNSTNTAAEQEDVAEYRLAIEAVSALLVEIRDDTSANDTVDEVLVNLSRDLADGEIDASSEAQLISGLDGFDISDLGNLDISSLRIPGTDILVNDVEQVLRSDTQATGVTQALRENINVSASLPIFSSDRDLDGVADSQDNCPSVSNIGQEDINGNNVGDLCDAVPIIAGALVAEVDEDGTVLIDLSRNVSDEDNTLAQLVFAVNGIQQNGASFTFSPQTNFNGSTSLIYTVSDYVSIVQGTVNITVIPQNDPGSIQLSGTAEQGQRLSAAVTDVDDVLQGSIRYRWFSGGSEIVGETASTLLLQQAQVGTTVTVSASYTDQDQTIEDLESLPSAVIANVNDVPQGSINISGLGRVGETLSANASLSDLDGLGGFTFSWFVDGNVVSSENNYTLQSNDEASLVFVRVTYTDGFGQEESVQSDSMTVLPAVNESVNAYLGIWTQDVPESETGNVLFFLNDGDYYAIQREEIDGFVGYEYGLFNPRENNLVISTTENHDGQALFCESEDNQGCDNLNVSSNVSGNELVVVIGEDNLNYARDAGTLTGIEGIWEASDGSITLMFLSNGDYYAVQRQSASSANGYEFGRYAVESNLSSISISTFDNNDGSGLFCEAEEDMESGCDALTFPISLSSGSLNLELNNRSLLLVNKSSIQ